MPSKKRPDPINGADQEPVNEPLEEENIIVEEEAVCPADAPAAPQAVNAEAEKLRNELSEQKDKYLRLLAEYDNYRKRSAKEREGIYSDVMSTITASFLPVYDNLERALSHHTDDEAYYKGIELIMAQYQEILGKLGVTFFGARGEAFDPALHSCVMHAEDPELGENVIAEVFQKGFKFGDRIIRCAMVRVAN